MLTGADPGHPQGAARGPGSSLDEIGAFEVNEAFASVAAGLAGRDRRRPELDSTLSGGAIALGHPLGASGARLMTTLVHHMRRDGIRYGLQTMCEGGGMANATVLELRADAWFT